VKCNPAEKTTGHCLVGPKQVAIDFDTTPAVNAEADGKKAEEEQLAAANKYYEYLKPNCLEVQVSYEERVKLRQEEIEALKKGLCILEAYTAYGPEGAADAC